MKPEISLSSTQRAAKGGTQKGVGHFFLFRSPFGNRFVTFLNAFGHFFAYSPFASPLLGQGVQPVVVLVSSGCETATWSMLKLRQALHPWTPLLFGLQQWRASE